MSNKYRPLYLVDIHYTLEKTSWTYNIMLVKDYFINRNWYLKKFQNLIYRKKMIAVHPFGGGFLEE